MSTSFNDQRQRHLTTKLNLAGKPYKAHLNLDIHMSVAIDHHKLLS